MSGDSEPNTGEILEIPVGEIGPGPLCRNHPSCRENARVYLVVLVL